MKTKFSIKEDKRTRAACHKILFFYACSLGSKIDMEKLKELKNFLMNSKEWDKLFGNSMWRDCVKNKVIMPHDNSFPIKTEISILKKIFSEEINSMTTELLKEIEFSKNHKHGDKVLFNEIPEGKTFYFPEDHMRLMKSRVSTNYYTKIGLTTASVALSVDGKMPFGSVFEVNPQMSVIYLNVVVQV